LRSEGRRSALLGFNAFLCLRRLAFTESCTNCDELDYPSWGRGGNVLCLRYYAVLGLPACPHPLLSSLSGIYEPGEGYVV
jgi:hypothetical protein